MILTANTGPAVCSSALYLELRGVPRELRFQRAGETRHAYWEGQVVLQDTHVIVPREGTLNRDSQGGLDGYCGA